CSILMISNDMEWMLAFSKGVQRFFLLNERRVETLEQAEARMQESRPDIVILAVREGLPSMDKLRPIVREKIYPPVPVIVIDSKPEGLDQWIKQGAEYACARRDLLNAVKHVQQLMRVAHFDGTLRGIEKNAKAISDRYERIYHDLPDPVAYVQDGLFIDANPAFLHTFGVKDRAALDELTLMNFVPHKSERGIKALMKKATEKDVVPSERFELQSLSGGKVDVNLSVSGITIHGEPGLQMYFRSAEAGGGGGTGLDPTTSLAGPRVIAASIKQTQERSEPKTVLGYWVYAWIENYREVWQKDGYKAAEIMMKTVADTTRRFLPPSTEISRFTDDGLALWLTGKKEESIKRVNGLIA
ncbi:MAG: PAS domain-containing protein, partial [Cardiobacterium sp.]